MGEESCLPIESDWVALMQQRGTIVHFAYSRARIEGSCAGAMEDSLFASVLHPLVLQGQRYHDDAAPMPSRERLSGEVCCSESCCESPAVLRQHVLLLR